MEFNLPLGAGPCGALRKHWAASSRRSCGDAYGYCQLGPQPGASLAAAAAHLLSCFLLTLIAADSGCISPLRQPTASSAAADHQALPAAPAVLCACIPFLPSARRLCCASRRACSCSCTGGNREGRRPGCSFSRSELPQAADPQAPCIPAGMHPGQQLSTRSAFPFPPVFVSQPSCRQILCAIEAPE